MQLDFAFLPPLLIVQGHQSRLSSEFNRELVTTNFDSTGLPRLPLNPESDPISRKTSVNEKPRLVQF